MTDHLKMHSMNKIDENVSKIAQLFPNCVTEAKAEDGTITHKIDFDMLKQELSNTLVEGREERYQFTWPDKKQAILTANAPINKTLRPCREESVNFDTTENLYIEGDNLEALKLLQETYLGKIKMIYIDPPYNTGNDFVYEDDFAQNAADYIANSGQFDGDGNRLVVNTESNGRYHTDWLNMMYPRLKLARDLLTDDGIIFISINDIEVHNLRNICENEIFGSTNFVADLIWANKEGGGSSDSKLFRIKHEHILCYAKNIDFIEITGNPISNAERYKGTDEYIQERGPYYLQKLGMGSIQYSASLDYPILAPDGTTIMPADNNGGKKACWRWSQEKFNRNKEKGFIEIKKDSSNIWTVYTKQYMNCDNDGNIITRTQRPMGIIEEYSSTQAAKMLENYGIGAYFNYSKPVDLIKYLISKVPNKDFYILDFFSGSGTTGQATMMLNAEDSGERKFILIQIPEQINSKKTDENKYETICEVAEERLKIAASKIENETDKGFRVLKIDSSNMEDVYYTPDHIDTNDLFKNNIKSDRTGEDLLFQTMLDLGIMLSCKIETKKINGKEVFCVENNYLMACFDDSVDEKTITEIAKEKPYYFVMRDPANSKDGDSLITNFEQIFTTYSPETVRKIL